MNKILLMASVLIIFVGCCFGKNSGVPSDKFKVPDVPKRPQLTTLSIFRPEDGKFIKYKPLGRFVAPDDHYIGLSAREMESLLLYVKQLEAYSDGLKNHPTFEVDEND